MDILHLKCIGALLFSLLIHTVVKYNETHELYTKGNVARLTFIEFLKLKPFSHVLNVLCAFIWLFFLPDAIKAFPEIKGSVFLANITHIAVCMIAGYANSSIALKLFGLGTKYAINVIDKKTNIADGKHLDENLR